MSSHTVEKIGGTSIADTTAALENVFIGDRRGGALYNRIFVVSAYAGITDRLLESKKSDAPGVYALFAASTADHRWSDALDDVVKQMQGINVRILGPHGDVDEAHRFVNDRIEWLRDRLSSLRHDCEEENNLATIRELLASVGEAHSAHNSALVLRQRGINAKFVDLTGYGDRTESTLDDRIMKALTPIDLQHELPVVTGYTASKEGLMAEYGRGYTEVTFSRIVALTNPFIAIIHKEFNISSGDPNVIGLNSVRTIKHINYDAAIRLASLGMEALHPIAVKQLCEARVPLRVSNTFQKNDIGTMIQGDHASGRLTTSIVTGIKNAYAIKVSGSSMNAVQQDLIVNDIVKNTCTRLVVKTLHMDTTLYYLVGSSQSAEQAVNQLRATFVTATISIKKVGVVAVIGCNENRVNLLTKVATTLTDNGVGFQCLHQLSDDSEILAIIDIHDYDRAIITLHQALVEQMSTPQCTMDMGARSMNVA